MDKVIKGLTTHDSPLNPLKEFTAARVGIGRTGTSIPTKQSLAFKLAHAHARDAVYSVLDIDGLSNDIKQFNLPVLLLHSKAGNRAEYLQRPDLGRKLKKSSANQLKEYTGDYDVSIIIADGLSAAAINENVIGLLNHLIPLFTAANLKLAPVCFVEQGRVAVSDKVAHLLNAKLSVILIGERPGLSSADSIGAYLTYGPKPGLTDESRNCISNIRPQGLMFKPAADKIFYLIQEAFRMKLTGIGLKDNQGLIGH
ncbi:ethanolamine ammonia-lyase subunit EutC [Mucilaginibacter sp. E4BP6]|uniref:ethanolamine ammonia-lyase subunit EutC n=1 Tax=Mucilaginibacter sp. E4BP6 TaxID=2723089 RepID=UPI0015CD8050|nr:ethanolamine ammonia-lyase subunit EutC [Mucilaginibacter sp. E4BP6]NYE65968.1 ethanolamine ammonia-lyase small subunit [Mucilaginibacter sp. E4BP6]